MKEDIERTLENIARVCHEANRAMQYNLNDPCPSQPWDVESELLRATTINGVRLIRLGYTNEEMHEEWCERLTAAGWVYGPVKNAMKREHPCLVPYRDLPSSQRVKTEIIRAIVLVMSLAQ